MYESRTPPTSCDSGATPTVSAPMAPQSLFIGRAFSTSLVTTVSSCTRCTSMTGDWPDTVIVSSRAPTPSSTLTGAVNPAVSSMPSRTTVVNPTRLKVTE
ncbi:MAG: hypothetical protein OXG35_13090 [Acidobacteria bacterium]|nr:hypothetical protein [Acidobacteriota bacterium]